MHKLLLLIAFIDISIPALGQADFRGVGQYPELRTLSGLAGGGYGVDANGYRSLSGPTSFSTPVAHVLGRSQWHFHMGNTSGNKWPSFKLQNSNGTSTITYGETIGRFNIALTDMFLASADGWPVQSFNLQIQPIPRDDSHWVWSAGIQHLNRGNGSAGDGHPEDFKSSRSVFAVTTYRLDTAYNPIYLTAGTGIRRFGPAFGSISYQVSNPLRFWVEHDTFGVNYGLLATQRIGPHRTEMNLLLGVIKGKYFTFSVGLGF